MYSDTEKRKSIARSLKSIAIKLESDSTDDEVMNEAFVNNTSIVDQLSEEDLCRVLLKMCRATGEEKMCSATDEEDEKAMINTSGAKDLEYEDQTSLTFLQPLSSLLRTFRFLLPLYYNRSTFASSIKLSGLVCFLVFILLFW